MTTLIPQDRKYPNNISFRMLDTSPTLYIEGQVLSRDQKSVAIVGSRTPSEYGVKMATLFASYLAKNGVTVISGLARGIDSVAHESALAVGGRTIAVVGSGLDIIYPPENKQLFKRITTCGAILSQFPLGTAPLPQNFLARNAIIAAMARAVLVVEGKSRSGTLSIANWAANLNVDVYAIPGRVDSVLSEAPNYLIRNGATAVVDPKDILDAIE